eukprot:scaffold294877_cov31-Tisochrysis_lutea.AAC.1
MATQGSNGHGPPLAGGRIEARNRRSSSTASISQRGTIFTAPPPLCRHAVGLVCSKSARIAGASRCPCLPASRARSGGDFPSLSFAH